MKQIISDPELVRNLKLKWLFVTAVQQSHVFFKPSQIAHWYTISDASLYLQIDVLRFGGLNQDQNVSPIFAFINDLLIFASPL